MDAYRLSRPFPGNASGVSSDAQQRRSLDPTSPDSFDFSPLFEDAILGILPSALLLLALPYRVLKLQNQRPKVAAGGLLHDNKMLFLAVFALMHLVLLVQQAILGPPLRTKATVAASALSFAASLGLFVLSHLEHVRSVRPSPIINGYLLLTLPFDIARVRTLFLVAASSSTSSGSSNNSGSIRTLASCYASMIGVKVLVLLAEAVEKRGILLEPYRGLSPEETSGIYSKSFFWWLNRLLTTGFRRVLRSDDLYPVDGDMTSALLLARMQRAWGAVADKSRPRTLLWAVILQANGKALAYCIVPRLLQMGFRYAQPFLLTSTVAFASDASQPDSVGWGLTGAFFVVLLGLAVSNGFYYHMTYRFVTSVRGSLVSLIYAKTVDLSITALDESVAVTLMSNDTQAICNGLEMINDLWAVPLELAIALFLLYRQLGVAMAAPAVLSVFSAAAIMGLAHHMGRAQKIWMQGIQTRVDVTAAMLGSMKSVKMLGFTGRLDRIVQGLRVAELRLSMLFRKLLVIRVFLGNILATIAPFATFAVFVLASTRSPDGQVLTAASAYTALSLISLLAWPVNDMIRAIPMINASVASLARIQAFLASDARRDHRIPLPLASGDGGATAVATWLERQGPREEPPSNTGGDIEMSTLPTAVAGTPVTPNDAIITAQNVSFSWILSDEAGEDAASSPPVVRDVSFTIARGQICLVIGPVGCGKSTLLKGVLGETPSTKGFLYTAAPESAYVDQTPWVRNASFRDNVLGCSVYDEAWYREVVSACALDVDVAALPNGHFTKVGSSGISLSGGQKQRLALARAVYARKDVVLLDDVFSGLDADTEERIFARLFSRQGGLFRRLGTTVLLVTHAVHRLAYADHVIAMATDGSISEQGPLEQLEKAGGYVAALEARQRAEDASEEERPDEKTTAAVITMAELEAEADNELEAAEDDLARQTGDLSLYRYYFGSVSWASTILWASCLLLYGIASKLSEYLVNFWTSAAESEGNSVDGFYLGLFFMLAMIATAGLIGGVAHYLMYFAPRSAEVLHERLLRSVMNAPLSFFTSVDMGTTTNRFSQDMTLIDNDLPYATVDFVLSLCSGIMSAILMCLSAGYFAAVMPPVVLVMWVLQKYYLRTSRQIRLLDLEAKSPLFSQFIETLRGLVTIRAFGWAGAFETQNLALLDTSQRPYYLLFCIQRWLELVLDLLVTGLAVVLMVLIVQLRAEVGAGYVGLAILNVLTFSQSLAQIIRNWTMLETSIGAVARVKSFTATTADENRPGEDQPLPDEEIVSSAGRNGGEKWPWPSRGAIEFRNVSASYTAPKNTNAVAGVGAGVGAESTSSEPGPLVLRNVTLSIRPGEKIGICGRSGSGKSSLLATLFRMLELVDAPGSQHDGSGSSITIDGTDITRLPRAKLRRRFNAIPQEPFFFTGGKVRENADPDGRHTDTAIVDALRRVGLWDSVLNNPAGSPGGRSGGSLATGLDAVMDADASGSLSHGQRQLFCLARALLAGRPGTAKNLGGEEGVHGTGDRSGCGRVVVLDEVSSSVDVEADALMQAVIRAEFAGCTILAVAHRLDTILDFDRVAIMSDGELVEVGEPRALLAREGSAFKELYETT